MTDTLNRGTVSRPWICFGEDDDTGISIEVGEIRFNLDAISVSFERWSEACIKRGHLTPLETVAIEQMLSSMPKWEPADG